MNWPIAERQIEAGSHAQFFCARFAKFALRKLCSGFPVSCPRSLSMMLNVCAKDYDRGVKSSLIVTLSLFCILRERQYKQDYVVNIAASSFYSCQTNLDSKVLLNDPTRDIMIFNFVYLTVIWLFTRINVVHLCQYNSSCKLKLENVNFFRLCL